jgi:hypothetical protein
MKGETLQLSDAPRPLSTTIPVTTFPARTVRSFRVEMSEALRGAIDGTCTQRDWHTEGDVGPLMSRCP